jgi:hypothetical protein
VETARVYHESLPPRETKEPTCARLAPGLGRIDSRAGDLRVRGHNNRPNQDGDTSADTDGYLVPAAAPLAVKSTKNNGRSNLRLPVRNIRAFTLMLPLEFRIGRFHSYSGWVVLLTATTGSPAEPDAQSK